MPMQQIDPAIYDDILGYGQSAGNLDPQIAAQQAMAQRLRAAGAAPNVRMSGRRAVAPSGLEYLGAMVNQGMAGSADRNTQGLQAQQAALRQLQVQRVLDALRGRPSPQATMPEIPGSTPQSGV